jgi:hypothetical protein
MLIILIAQYLNIASRVGLNVGFPILKREANRNCKTEQKDITVRPNVFDKYIKGSFVCDRHSLGERTQKAYYSSPGTWDMGHGTWVYRK